jgi:hypothetical protein
MKLSVEPALLPNQLLKASLGIPMPNGLQSCTAFAKVFFVRYFRESIPLHRDGSGRLGDGVGKSVAKDLIAIAEKSRPALIAVLITSLAETQNPDFPSFTRKADKNFKSRISAYPSQPCPRPPDTAIFFSRR